MQKTLRRKKTPGGGGGCAWPGYARPGTAPPPPPPGTKTTEDRRTNEGVRAIPTPQKTHGEDTYGVLRNRIL